MKALKILVTQISCDDMETKNTSVITTNRKLFQQMCVGVFGPTSCCTLLSISQQGNTR